MITLKMLHKATEQEVFNQVAEHLLTQNKQSQLSREGNEISIGCAYHSRDGLKCAAGILIAKSEYRESMEGKCWGAVIAESGCEGQHSNLIRDLQDIHDNCTVIEWARELARTAGKYDLDFKHGELKWPQKTQ